jgi:hypothetical protein
MIDPSITVAERPPEQNGGRDTRPRLLDQFWLRSAGFPFDWLKELGLHEAKEPLHRYEAVRTRLAALDGPLKQAIQAGMGLLPGKISRLFDAGHPLLVSGLPYALAGLSPGLEARNLALKDLEAAQAEWEKAFSADMLRLRSQLVGHLHEPDTLEAIAISNPQAHDRVLSLASADLHKLDKASRQNLRMGWNFLQRFCAKNDTISFFGPITWGTFDAHAQTNVRLDNRQGAWLNGRIATRRVMLEHWVLAAIAKAASRDPAIAPHLPCRLSESYDIETDLLLAPDGRRVRLPPLHVRLVAAAAHAWPKGLSKADCLALGGSDMTAALLGARQALIDKGILVADLRLSPTTREPYAALRDKLGNVPKTEGWLALLDALQADAQAYRDAGRMERLAIMARMKERLEAQGIETARETGRMYVGRYPLYEDCERAASIVLGASLRETILHDLRPVMAIYTWLTGAIAELIQQQAESLCRTLTETAGHRLDFVTFLRHWRALPEPDLSPIRQALRTAWDKLLGPDETADASLDPHDVETLIADLYQSGLTSSKPRRTGFDFHSPDLMFVAPSFEALNAGNFNIVIGEVHPGVATASQPVAMPFCPDRAGLEKSMASLIGPDRLAVADSSRFYQRSQIDWPDSENLVRLVLPGDAGSADPMRCIPAARLRLSMADGKACHLIDPKTGKSFALLDALASDLHRCLFAVAGQALASHRRQALRHGKVILKRRLREIDGLSLPQAANPAENALDYAAWHDFFMEQAWPRFTFARIEGEEKPVLVDRDNPLSVDAFARLAKGKASIALSDMLPGPDGLWLHDERGTYCAELRMTLRG